MRGGDHDDKSIESRLKNLDRKRGIKGNFKIFYRRSLIWYENKKIFLKLKEGLRSELE